MTNANAIQKVSPQEITLPSAARNETGWTYRPEVDILDTPDAVLVYADVPGATKESITVSLDQGTLTLEAVVEPRLPEHLLRQEYGVGNYFRRFSIDEAIDAEHIRASYDAGVLTVTLPKTAGARRKLIPIA